MVLFGRNHPALFLFALSLGDQIYEFLHQLHRTFPYPCKVIDFANGCLRLLLDFNIMQKRESQSAFRWHRFRSSKRFVYFVVNLAVFTDAYLYGLIIPVVPFALSEYAGVPTQELQKWIAILLGAYGAGLIVASPIAGHLADRSNSRRATYMLGLVALAVSTVMFSVGRSVAVLVVARSLQGASSAFVHCVGVVRGASHTFYLLRNKLIRDQSILSDTVGDDGVGPAMGFVTLWIAVGMTTGPICGGLLYHRFGYSAVFVSAYALVGVDVLFRIIMLERSPEHEEDDDAKPILADPTSNSAPATPSRYLHPSYGSTTPEASNSTPSSTTLTANPTPASSPNTSPTSHESPPTSSNSSLLIPHPLHHHPPPISSPTLLLLTSPRYAIALLGSLTVSTLLTLLESTLPLYLSRTFHSSSADIGLILLALSIPAVLSPLTGHLSDRHGAKIMLVVGYGGLAPLWILLGFIRGADDGGVGLKGQIVGLCVVLVGLGVGLDCILTPSFAEAKGAADDVSASSHHQSASQYPTSPSSRSTASLNADEGQTKTKEVGGKAYGAAFAMMNMAYAAGSMCGPLVGGAVMSGVGWQGLTMGTGVVCAVGGAVVFGVGRRKMKEERKMEERDGGRADNGVEDGG